MNTLQPGKYWLKGVPNDYKRVDTRVELIGRIPWESDYYRVRLPNGSLSVASGSMLEPRQPMAAAILSMGAL